MGGILPTKFLSFCIEGIFLSWVKCHGPEIPVFRSRRLKDLKFYQNLQSNLKVTLGYIVSP